MQAFDERMARCGARQRHRFRGQRLLSLDLFRAGSRNANSVTRQDAVVSPVRME